MGGQVGYNFTAFISSMSDSWTVQDFKVQDCFNESKIMLSLYFSVLNFYIGCLSKAHIWIPVIVL